jgi:hypothetical protein
MCRWRGWFALWVCGCFSLSPDAALAEAQGKTFAITVADTLSGVWSAPLYFLEDGTLFVDVPDWYNVTGMYTETVDDTTGASTLTATIYDSNGWWGIFAASTTQTTLGGIQPATLISGFGLGNAGDVFLFAGVSFDPIDSSAEAAPEEQDPPADNPAPRRSPRRRR